MGDSADTARERQAAKKVPKRKKKPVLGPPVPTFKPSADARAFGAATSIFVPPELQNERGPKKVPRRQSVVLKPEKPKPETTAQKKARQKRETHARERLRLGLRISSPTGRNNLDAVPERIPHRSHSTIDLPFGQHITMWKPAHDIALGLGMAGKAAAIKGAKGIESWAGEVADVPGNTLRALLDQSPAGPRGVPQGLAKAGRVVGEAEPVVRPVDATAKFIGSEEGQEEIWGKSLVNLALHGDTPGSGMEAAGLSLGILGILPLGKITQLAKLGRAARVAGKIGQALPDTPERTAWKAAMAQRLGEEKANDLILLTDSAARNLHPKNPNLLYEQTPMHAGNFADFAPGGTTRFQTEAGPRQGIVEGFTGQTKRPIGKKAAFKHVNASVDNLVHFDTFEGDPAMLDKVGPDHFQIEVLTDPENQTWETHDLTMEQARQVLKQGSGHFVNDDVVGVGTPVFRAELPAQVAKLPEEGLSKEQTAGQLRNAVKPSEWEDSGMEAFLAEYAPGEKIPKSEIQYHLATALNAYDLDEVIYRSDSGQLITNRIAGGESATMWASYADGGLIVRDPTDAEPYIELFMKLRTPLRTRVRRGLFGDNPFPSSYVGKGDVHWREDDVVGHVRMHLITDTDGKKALLVDEVQSDWASQWGSLKKRTSMVEGEASVPDKADSRIKDLEDQSRRIAEDIAIMEQDPSRYAAEIADLEDLYRTNRDQLNDLRDLSDNVPGPPPLGSKQMEALVKRTLRFAQESGVERIIIVQGDVQAIRNQAYRVTPKGRAIQIHDNPNWQNDVAKLRDDAAGMSQAEIQAYANDPAHREGMVKGFMDLYGQGNEAGKVQKIFEKEMGETGAVKQGIFHGGYADEGRAFSRQPPQDDFVIDGVRYMEDPTFPEPKRGDRVMTVEGPGIVQAAYANGEIGVEIGRRMVVKPAHYVHVIVPDPNAGPVGPAVHAMDGYVIEMTDAAKAKVAAPMAYYQQRAWEAIPKGASEFFADGTSAIHLFEGADVSTVIHELSHVVLPDLNDVDRAILNRHFGNFATTADHEAYARALERYVYDGMAATSELDGVFAKIKAWMGQVYLHVNNIGAHVHPEVKQVFDRMLVKNETPAEQLVRLLKTAPKIRKAQKAGYSAERGKRIAQMFDEWTGEEGVDEFHSALSALKGELPKEEYTGLDDLTPEAVASLIKSIRFSTKVRPFEKVRAAEAVIRATEGAVPTDSELLLLNRVFGKDAGFRKQTLKGIEKVIVEVWNIPRSIAASFDLSAPLRQGLIAGTRHPILFAKAFKPMFKALSSEERAADIAEEIANRENFVHYGRGKLAIETSASSPDLAMREEQFYSSYAEQFIPPVKWSGRAYEAFLHRLRADVFDLTMEAARAKGVNVESDEFVEGLGRMVNQMTGRGVLPETHLLRVETSAPLLNTFLFSPRLLASRINMISPAYYIKLYQSDPFLFAEATKNLMSTALATGMVLAVAAQMPGVTVGMDPTSANFGKIRIGDTRIDIMAGFGPLLVFFTRLTVGRSTSSTTGKTQDLKGGFGNSSRLDIVYRFLESKAAPTTGIGLDVLRGQTFIGEPVTLKGEAINSTAPMMLRDVLDVWREPKDPVDAATAAAVALFFGTFGIGFSSYGAKKPKSTGGGGGGGDDDPYAPDSGPAGGEDPYAPVDNSPSADPYAPG